VPAAGFRARLTRVPGTTAKGVLDEALWLPVLLNDVSFDEGAEHTEFRSIAAGEFSVPGPGGRDARSLRSVDLETLTIVWDVPWLTAWNTISPKEMRFALRDILRARTPFKLLITQRPSGETIFSGDVTLRNLTRTYRFGAGGLTYYDLAIREWRDPSVKRRGSGRAGGGKGGKGGDKARFPARHKLTAKDTGNSLSKKYYGDYDGAKRILADIGLKAWGPSSDIVKSRKFKVGDVIVINAPGKGPNVGQGEGVIR
jgi:hypothetical protein